MKKQIIIAGLGRFGSSLATGLYQIGHDVMAIDNNEKRVQDIMGNVTYAVTADATDENVLEELAVKNFDAAVVAIGSSIQSSIMATVLFKTMGVNFIVARANNKLHGETLERIGANLVIRPEEETGTRLAHNLFRPAVEAYMEIIPDFGISRITVPERFVNMSLKETGLAEARDKYGLAILALKRGNNVTLSPDTDDKLREGDVLVLAGKDEFVDRFNA